MSRELLERAAKAAGMIVKKNTEVVDADDQFIGIKVRDTERDKYRLWNPLTDDGDAFRLAVKLNMTVGFDSLPDGAIVYVSAEWHEQWDRGFRIMEWLHKDPAAATRLAIVRAAAAIGEAK